MRMIAKIERNCWTKSLALDVKFIANDLLLGEERSSRPFGAAVCHVIVRVCTLVLECLGKDSQTDLGAVVEGRRRSTGARAA